MPSTHGTATPVIVCVWDVDETLLLLNSLVHGLFPCATPSDAQPSAAAVATAAGGGLEVAADSAQQQQKQRKAHIDLGERLMARLLNILDALFLFPVVESLDPMHWRDFAGPDGVLLQPPGGLVGVRAGSEQPLQPEGAHLGEAQPAATQAEEAAAAAASGVPQSQQQEQQQSEQQQQQSRQQEQQQQQHQSEKQQGALEGVARGLEGEGHPSPARKRLRPSPTIQEVLQQAVRLYQGGFEALDLSAEERAAILQLREEVDAVSGGWLAASSALLGAVSAEASTRGCTVRHCVVSTGQLVATFAKLLFFGLGDFIAPENVYSTSGQTKATAFRAVRQSFGEGAAYVAIGDGREEREAAAEMGWPFIQISLVGGSGAQAQQLQEPGPPLGQRIQQVMAGDVVDQALRGVASHSH